MGQPVKLSDKLILNARVAAKRQERSIASQVEFWAKLGQAAEQMLDGRRIEVLRTKGSPQSLSEAIGSVGSKKAQLRLKQHLDNLPYPHFEQHPENPDLLIRIDENGKRTQGRFVGRQFVEVAVSGKAAARRNPAVKPVRSARKS